MPKSGGSAAEVALDANPRITALMCTADVLALSAMDYLRARGIYVPGQMTVTGFDGLPEAISRGLTTGGTVKPAQRPPRQCAASKDQWPPPAFPGYAASGFGGAAALGDTGRRSAGH